MKILKSWLNDYISTNLSDIELASRLSLNGVAVDSILGGIDENVVVGRILKIEKHPNADRLQIATVFDGKVEFTVVCGAPNIEVGQTVPLAKVGAKLPAFEIRKSAIRGVESEGMLCAPDELGLGEDHAGILVLPDTYEVGHKLSEYIAEDVVFDIEITPNRGDLLSHIGVAREVAALSDQQVRKSPVELPLSSQNINEVLKLTVSSKNCIQYLGRMIRGVKVEESPKWLKDRLIALGQKPINNIVDVTNYIMLDLGQPLHAFDAAKISKGIVVRQAEKGEKIVTLDGINRELAPSTLVIADMNKSIAIAGLMGGQNSEIDSNTVDIILEAAEFDRKNVRKSSKELGLSTDASYRFERGIDSGGVEYSLNKAAKMIKDIAGGVVLAGVIRAGEKQAADSSLFDGAKINRLLGTVLSDDQMRHILKLLGFSFDGNNAVSPSWRHDVTLWADLAEEIGRIYGYEKITQISLPKTEKPKKSAYYSEEYIKDLLANSGFNEVLTYSFLSEEEIKAAGLDAKNLLEVANPIQKENKYLRNSLVPGLLKAIAKNPTFDIAPIFELGDVFSKKDERRNIALAAAGKDAKKMIEDAVLQLKSVANHKMPDIRELSREEIQRYKIKKPVTYVFETEVASVIKGAKLSDKELELKVSNKPVHYRILSKYPSLTRDLAFIVDRVVKPAEIEEDIYLTSDKVNRVELFDEFASDKFGKGKKNLAFHIYLQDMEKTMTDQEAEIITDQIVKIVSQKYKAELRKF